MPEIWKVNNRSGPTERSEDVASRSRGRTAPAVMARGLIARLAVWCFRHRWWVVACWAVIAAVGAVCSAGVLDRVETTGLVSRNAESSVADRVLTAAGVSQDDVLVLIDGVDVKAAATREAVSGAAQRIAAMPEVAKVTDWYEAGMPQLQSRDGRATVISVRLKEADSRVTDGSLKAFNDAVNPLRSTLSGASVALGGESILWKQLADQSAADLQRGERISLPVTFIALIIIFGGLRAGLIPILTTAASVAGSLIALYGVSQIMPMDSNVPTVVTVLGLGLSIDYGLLYVSRFRQERVVRGSAIAAAHASAHPATHTVVFSGVVVASSLAALFIFDSPLYRAMAAGGIAVTLVSLLTSVTLTPALLRILGSKMRVRGTALHRRRRMPLLSLARGVARHPWIVLVLVTGALAVAATPALDITLRDSRAKGLPDSFSSRHVAETLQERFDGGDTIPIIVLSRGSLEELNTYTEALRLRTDVRAVTSPVKLPNGFWSLVVTPTDTGTGAAAQGVVRAIRADPLVFDMIVAGPAAITTDFMDMMKSKASLVFAAIAFSTFVLLAFMSGSVVIPLKALLMNILSLTASFGVIVLVFQEGRLHDFTGVEAVGSIEPWIPMLIFVFTFALSMDYEVFLISAIKEMRDRGMPNGEAIAHGVHRSGKLVTSAALLMILVFMGFAMGESVQIKELGAAMGLAVFIDATLVRCLLLPASMALLGEANWWAPRRRKGAAMGTKPQPVAPPFSRSVPRFSHLRTNEQFRLVAPETVLPRRRYPAIPSISQNLTSATPEFLNGHPGQG